MPWDVILETISPTKTSDWFRIYPGISLRVTHTLGRTCHSSLELAAPQGMYLVAKIVGSVDLAFLVIFKP